MPHLDSVSVLATVTEIVADSLRVTPARVTADSNLILDLNAESIDLVDIRFRLEERFGFKIDQRSFIASVVEGTTTDIQERLTVGRLVAFILKQAA